MENIELPPLGEIVRIHSPYSEFHGAMGFVTEYIDTVGAPSTLALNVHVSGRGDVVVEIDCLKWRKKRKK